jgi:hypothetical protein
VGWVVEPGYYDLLYNAVYFVVQRTTICVSLGIVLFLMGRSSPSNSGNVQVAPVTRGPTGRVGGSNENNHSKGGSKDKNSDGKGSFRQPPSQRPSDAGLPSVQRGTLVSHGSWANAVSHVGGVTVGVGMMISPLGSPLSNGGQNGNGVLSPTGVAFRGMSPTSPGYVPHHYQYQNASSPDRGNGNGNNKNGSRRKLGSPMSSSGEASSPNQTNNGQYSSHNTGSNKRWPLSPQSSAISATSIRAAMIMSAGGTPAQSLVTAAVPMIIDGNNHYHQGNGGNTSPSASSIPSALVIHHPRHHGHHGGPTSIIVTPPPTDAPLPQSSRPYLIQTPLPMPSAPTAAPFPPPLFSPPSIVDDDDHQQQLQADQSEFEHNSLIVETHSTEDETPRHLPIQSQAAVEPSAVIHA